jgi:hypothetical protein
LTYLKASLLSALTLAALFVLIEAGILVRRAQMAIPAIVADVHNTATDYQRVAQVTVGVEAPLRAMLKANKESSDQVARNSVAATKQLTADLVDLGATIQTANTAIGHIDKAVADTAQSVTADISDTNQELKPILADLATSSEALAKQTPVILGQLTITTQNVAGITDDTHHATTDLAAYVHRNTAPVRGTYNLIKSLIGLTFESRGAIGK